MKNLLLVEKVNELFKILSTDPTLNKIINSKDNLEIESGDKNLLKFENLQMISPINFIEERLNKHKSPLKNNFQDINKITQLINLISQAKAFVRLNHIGFCYKVESIEKERELVKNLINKAELHLYEEWSDENASWLFYGDIEKDWQNPLIELVPIVQTNDKWQDLWLPHIQIDLDTTLSREEIEKYISEVFGEEIKPYPIIIEGVTYIMRTRIGIIDGVNINLDFATNKRGVKFHRENILKQII